MGLRTLQNQINPDLVTKASTFIYETPDIDFQQADKIRERLCFKKFVYDWQTSEKFETRDVLYFTRASTTEIIKATRGFFVSLISFKNVRGQ